MYIADVAAKQPGGGTPKFYANQPSHSTTRVTLCDFVAFNLVNEIHVCVLQP